MQTRSTRRWPRLPELVRAAARCTERPAALRRRRHRRDLGRHAVQQHRRVRRRARHRRLAAVRVSASQGAVKVQPVEQIELLFPMRVDEMEIAPDSMGVGGGSAAPVHTVVLPRDVECITFGDGSRTRRTECSAGPPASAGAPSSRMTTDTAASSRRPAGHPRRRQALVGVSSGGGGYGDRPSARSSTSRADARDGIITREAAAESSASCRRRVTVEEAAKPRRGATLRGRGRLWSRHARSIDLAGEGDAGGERVPGESAVSAGHRIGVDIGGTFTDFTLVDAAAALGSGRRTRRPTIPCAR